MADEQPNESNVSDVPDHGTPQRYDAGCRCQYCQYGHREIDHERLSLVTCYRYGCRCERCCKAMSDKGRLDAQRRKAYRRLRQQAPVRDSNPGGDDVIILRVTYS